MEERSGELQGLSMCRFCLDERGPFADIHERSPTDGPANMVPLPVQIMACVGIEVLVNDGMPQLICKPCRTQIIQSYIFKASCKQSDYALKVYLATGNLVKPYKKQVMPVDVAVENIPEAMIVEEQERPAELSPPTPPPPQQQEHHKEVSEVTVETTHEVVNQLTFTENDVEQEEQRAEEIPESEYAENSIDPVLKVTTDVFPCAHCERSFPLKQLLDLHARNHERERTFGCHDCGRKFFTKYDLSKHQQTHTSSKPFSCVICNKTFSREALLHRHEKTHTDVAKYLCMQCDRTFLTRADLDLHSEKHKKNRPFSCRICKKSFVFKQGLERHEQTHTEEKPHKCNYCEASFISPIKLVRHITSHAGLRPYPCKLCGRTFLLSHHLTRHMRSHYASKSSIVEPIGAFKCDTCSMSFRRKDSLINHSAIHSMVNLKCVICNTNFTSAKEVKEHITTHLAGLPYPCDKCDYSFDTQDQLEEHEFKHAEMEYEDQIEQEVTEEENARELEHYNQCEAMETMSADEVFTITNDDDNNPQLVPKKTHIKNYAQFLKDELGSDLEDEIVPEASNEVISEEDTNPEPIKPIVRTEGMKMYARKAGFERLKFLPDIQYQAGSEDDSSVINLDDLELSQQVVKNLSAKQFLDMKVGNKMVRVQKLMMTKTQIDAMAKEGKIEMKGGAIILKKGAAASTPLTKQITIENIIGEHKPQVYKQPVTKTYMRKGSPGMSHVIRGETDSHGN